MSSERARLFDGILLFAVVAILLLGLIMVASASIEISQEKFHTPFHFLIRQMVFLCLAVVVSRFTLKLSMQKIEKYSPYIFLAAVFFLLLVLIPHVGRSINGSSRWLGIGPVGLQVSEFAKLATILYLAGYLVRRNDQIQSHFSGFVRPLCVLAIIAVLLLKEPDFGASVVIIATAMAMMFLAGMRISYFVLLFIAVSGLLTLIAVSSPYRVVRITSFLHPWLNQYGSGYQLTQALIAFGNGGFWGVGLGNSIQKLFYLPEAQTDFLFAILAEELGLVGIAVLFALYTLLVTRAFVIARKAQKLGENYSAFVCYGIGLWLGLQFLINVGVNAGVLPTKGLTLPLMSYGGSSLLIDVVAISFLFRTEYESRLAKFGLKASKPYRV